MGRRTDQRHPMNSLFDPGKEAVRHERAIRSLRDRTGTPVAEVRSLFAKEFSRANVRRILRRKSESSRRR